MSMLWIKGHSGLTGNEMADLYANTAVEECIQTNITTMRDLKNEATNRLKIDWTPSLNMHYNKHITLTQQT